MEELDDSSLTDRKINAEAVESQSDLGMDAKIQMPISFEASFSSSKSTSYNGCKKRGGKLMEACLIILQGTGITTMSGYRLSPRPSQMPLWFSLCHLLTAQAVLSQPLLNIRSTFLYTDCQIKSRTYGELHLYHDLVTVLALS